MKSRTSNAKGKPAKPASRVARPRTVRGAVKAPENPSSAVSWKRMAISLSIAMAVILGTYYLGRPKPVVARPKPVPQLLTEAATAFAAKNYTESANLYE